MPKQIPTKNVKATEKVDEIFLGLDGKEKKVAAGLLKILAAAFCYTLQGDVVR